MKFLVFGGGGKVARHLARLAVKDGHQVVPIVRNDEQYVLLSPAYAWPYLVDMLTALATY